MLKAALCGSYVNLGCQADRDGALDNALNTFVTLLLSIPRQTSWTTPSSPDYALYMECLARTHGLPGHPRAAGVPVYPASIQACRLGGNLNYFTDTMVCYGLLCYACHIPFTSHGKSLTKWGRK